MNNYSIWNTKSAMSPGSGEREVDLGGQHVGEFVKHQGILMGYNTLLFRPEP
jgi:hypothetical protein